MANTFSRRAEFAYISRLTKHGAKFVACGGIFNRILIAERDSGGGVTYLGKSAELSAEPVDVVSDGTPSAYYALTDFGVTKLSAAAEPAVLDEFLFDSGASSQRWMFYTASGRLLVPLARGGVRLMTTAGVTLAELPGLCSEATAAVLDGTTLYVFDSLRARLVTITVGASTLTYEGTTSAPNCREVLRAVIDGDNLYCLNRHRVVRFDISSATEPERAQDYGLQSVTYTDIVVIGSDQIWCGFSTPTNAQVGDLFFGPTFGVWDSANAELQAAAPGMAAWTVNTSVPYFTEDDFVPSEPEVELPDPPVITSALTADGTEGEVFSYTITATGVGPINFGASGLPSWLTLNGTTGEITGTPPDDSANDYNVTITATNAGGADTETLVITVAPSVASFVSVTMNGNINDAILVDGSFLYVVGTFTSVTDDLGTVTRNRAACLDIRTARWTAWNPNSSAVLQSVWADALTAPTYVYIGTTAGSPHSMGGVSTSVGRTNPTSGAVDSGWTVSTDAAVHCGCVFGSNVYIGGGFSSIQSTTREFCGAVSNGATATLQSWRPGNGDNIDTSDWILGSGPIRSMGVYSGSILMSGAFFVRTAAVLTDYLAMGWGRCNPTSGVFSQVGSGYGNQAAVQRIIVGEQGLYWCHSNDGSSQLLRELPEWDAPPAMTWAASRWAILSFITSQPAVYPAPPNGGNNFVYDMVDDPDSTDLFIIGEFDDAFGVAARDGVVRVTSSAGYVSGFAPVFSAAPELRRGFRAGPALIIVGNFSGGTVNGLARVGIAALDAVTGANY